ncbi:MAG: urea transporter, partial [Streptosporangiaceae bacterium]
MVTETSHFAPYARGPVPWRAAVRFGEIVLRGIGQVMLQNSVWSGLLFLLGIFYSSWVYG